MQSMGAFEAKTHFSALLETVEKGEEVLITKHGRPVARLSPIHFNKTTVQETIHALERFQSTHRLILGLDWKALRDQARK